MIASVQDRLQSLWSGIILLGTKISKKTWYTRVYQS